jgi:hypothetical protein
MMESMAASGGGDRRFALRKDDDITTDDALHLGNPIWHAPAELARDSGSMLLGTSLLRGSHCGSNRNGGNDGSGRFALRASQLMMPFVQGILLNMCLLNFQEAWVVCC